MLKIKVFTLGLILLFVGTSSVFAQDGYGRIEGVVTDATTQETLVGVNVSIAGTSLGDATTLDGTYIIRRVSAGTQTIVVSYIGYQRVEQEVEISDGETLELNFELSLETVEGQEITISSQAEGQRSAINEQLTAREIKNVVSSEKIRELPDADAATALSRLPGVSLQDGDKVVVRGIQAKMNTVMVNGIQLPSTDVNDRSTNLGFISSNMLSGIEVTKAVTPDMDANSIGGVVNLRLREAPEGLHYDLMTQGGYNTQDHTEDNYQVWGSISNRFLSDKLGVFLQANARRENTGGDIANAGYDFIYTGDFPPPGEASKGMNSFSYSDQVNIIEQRGGSLIMDYQIPNGKFVLQNTYAFTDNNSTTHRDVLEFSADLLRTFRIVRDKHSKHLIVNAFQGENDFDLFNINYGLSHAYSEKDTDLRYGENFAFGFRYAGAGEPFEGDFSREARLQLTPQDMYNVELNNDLAEQATFIENGESMKENFSERAFNGNFNITVPVAFTEDISGEFRTGGNFRQTNRNNDIERVLARITQDPTGSNALAADWMREQGMDPTVRLQFSDFKDYDYVSDRGDLFLDGLYTMSEVMDTDLMDQYIRLASPGWGRHVADSRSADFEGTETLLAGYGMFDLKVGSRLQILGGVRYESLNMKYEADLVRQTHGVDGDSIIPNEDSVNVDRKMLADSLSTSDETLGHLFPNIQLRYKFTEWMDLRLAYTKTLSRPDYNAIVPKVFIINSGQGSAGNPYLQPSESDNYDAYLSFYNNQIGLFTVGAFYKKIENIFFGVNRLYQAMPDQVIYPDSSEFERLNLSYSNANATISTFLNNPNPAHVKGFELDWQTHFWYLPKPFNNTVLNVNYTRLFSEMAYEYINIQSETICDPRCSTSFFENQTTRKARLLQQGDHIVNVALGVDYEGFSGRVSFRMQGDVQTNAPGQRPEDDTFTGNIYYWDFTLRQKLPVDGLSLFANGINIFHTPNKSYQTFPREDGGPSLENLTNESYYPRRFQLGIRFSY
ncbi:MAG: TonB-dependent receptor [Gracilimonas sp.]